MAYRRGEEFGTIQGKFVSIRKSFVQLALMLLLVPGLAAAKERKFTPVPGVGQEIRYSDGDAILVTGNSYGNIAVNLVPLNRKWVLLNVWIENASEQQFNVSEAAFSASSGSNRLVVLNYEERQKAQKRKQMWAMVATGVVAGLNSYNASNAGYSSYSGNYGGRTTSAYGTTYSSGSYYGTSYSSGINYLAQANAAAQNEAMFDRYQNAANIANQNLQERALKANTLAPGQSVYGDIQLMLPKVVKGAAAEISINVMLAGQPVTLNFREGDHVVQFAASDVPIQTAPAASYAPAPAADPAPMPGGGMGGDQGIRQVLAPEGSLEVEVGRRRAEAFAHPSGSAARVEFTKMNCLGQFGLVSSSAGKAIFESACETGSRQLLECRGASCSALN